MKLPFTANVHPELVLAEEPTERIDLRAEYAAIIASCKRTSDRSIRTARACRGRS